MNWGKYDIDVSKVVGGKTICPKCSHNRKHKKDKCLSVDLTEGLFNCHNCGYSGSAKDFKKKEYVKPQPRLEKLGEKSLKFFESDRGISNNTILRFKVTEAKEWMPQFEREVSCICFNYYRGEELTNIKFRGPQKAFKMAKSAELIFYNLNSIEGESECVITEGEMDCLTLYECGILNSVSVPNGASKGNQKLEYLDNCWQYFEDKTKIILAVDNDEAGLSLRDELARRLGKEKCFTVNYPEGCKDANEVLLKYGKEEVINLIKQAKEIPLEGIITMDAMFPTIQDWYDNGYPKGAKANIKNFDHYLTFVPGQLTIITGIPGHGKDEFANWIMTNLAKHENWIWGICGFEELPHQTVTKLMEKYSGKSFDFRQDKYNRINQDEYERSLIFVEDHFRLIDSENIETNLESILELSVKMVKRFGIKGLCINPWNWIEHQRDSFISETEYVSIALSKIIQFAKKFNVHVFLMAHPTKIMKNKETKKYEVPTLYSISGSANFFNKTHNGITVYRDETTVDVHIQKVKQSWLGKVGLCQFTYNTLTRQYSAIEDWNTQNFTPINEMF